MSYKSLNIHLLIVCFKLINFTFSTFQILVPEMPISFLCNTAQTKCINPLNAELNPICHLLALLGGATIVVVSRLRVK